MSEGNKGKEFTIEKINKLDSEGKKKITENESSDYESDITDDITDDDIDSETSNE